MLEPVRLSLSSFQPDKCFPPYLNTPRSLEACRVHGCNPVELVEIPFSEFQKDFPSDHDAARRRYERIDGARKRLLEEVKREWKRLVDSGWKPEKIRPRSGRESIVAVSPKAHCTLLEIQAAKFRKIEEENMLSLQRNLKMQLMKADAEVKHKKIIEKHESIQQQNESCKDERRMQLQELYKEQLMMQKEKEYEEMQQIKEEQERFAEAIRKNSEQTKEQRKLEKSWREKKEEDRVQSQEYTKQTRESIMNNLDNKMKNRKKVAEIREKAIEDHMKEFYDRRQEEWNSKGKDISTKIEQAREEKRRFEEENRQQILEKIKHHEDQRRHAEELRNSLKNQTAPTDLNRHHEKIQQIKEKNEAVIQEKTYRTLTAMQIKADHAQRELEKIKEAQDRRKSIKAIRQEAHEIALLRAQKAEEYRKERIEQQIKAKEERVEAIKQGFQLLNKMRNSMHDIMEKTTAVLSDEFNRLKHTDQFEPGQVIEKAMHVSEKVLFPKLQRTFGLNDPNEEEPLNKLFKNTGDGISFNLGNAEKDSTPFLTETSDSGPLFEGDKTGYSAKSANRKAKTAGLIYRIDPNVPIHIEPVPLPIQAVTKDSLKTILIENKNKIESIPDPFSPTISPKSGHAARRAKSNDRYNSDDEDQEYPAPILKLQNEDGTFEEHERLKTKSQPELRKINTSHNQKRAMTSSGKFSRSKSVENTSPDQQNHHDPNDPKLPVYPFVAGAEYAEKEYEEGKKSPTNPLRKSREKLRTDVNDKAKYLATPPGRFRREFSLDHPYAPGGKGKYKKEIDKGLKPTGIDLGDLTRMNEAKSKNMTSDVEETIKLADKVEKLTYEAQTSVIDPEKAMDDLKKELNILLEAVLEEEKSAEDERIQALKSVHDPNEKQQLEKIFAEARQRASDRIVAATREYDQALKQALLKTMNLGNMIST